MDDRIMPAVITDNKTGEKYELDFSRDSIRFAENRGFELENVAKFPVTGVADLFFYAFRMHHRNVSRDKTDKLMERWGGIPEGLLTRLIQLYQQAMTANNVQTDEDAAKNGELTLEL